MFSAISLLFISSITIALWIGGKSDPTSIVADPYRSVSQIASLLGTVYLSYNFALATKVRILDRLFNGLDKIYKVHRLTGIFSFVLLLNHPILLALRNIANTDLLLKYFLPSSNLSYSLGIFSLWSMIILIVITLYAKIPYDLWLKSHKLMGVPLILTSFHVYLISSDITSNYYLRVWIFSFLFLALISFFYKLLFYKKLSPKRVYLVSEVKRYLDIIEVHMTPKSKRLNYLPGQFVYISVTGNRNVNPEEHPFSIVSAPQDQKLILAIKIEGDYTLSLRNLKVGDTIIVRGPYGQFSRKYLAKKKEAVWIAGGIGITPFLSLLTSRQTADASPVDFFYVVRKESDACYDQYVKNHLNLLKSNKINYHLHLSSQKGRINANSVCSTIGRIKDKMILICGPARMMESLRTQFIEMGVSSNSILMEDFNLL